jgi:cytoskeletal protein CcmA (bactofilin family)
MALWKENTPPNAAGAVPAPQPAAAPEPRVAERVEPRTTNEAVVAPPPRRPAPPQGVQRADSGESVIAANLSIDGKIEGNGNVRMAGRFKGDVRIDGNFTIDTGAQVTGQVLAGIVVVGGELQGNVESAKRLDVLESGVIVGDVKAGSITVAAGSRMRGHVEFGWDDEKSLKVASSAVGKG